MTRYRDGYELEQAAKKDLEANGYLVVRSGGSKGVADLVAVKRSEVLLVQAKTDGKIGPAERAALHRAAFTSGSIPLVVSWHKDGRAARRPRYRLVAWTPGKDRAELGAIWTPDWRLEDDTL